MMKLEDLTTIDQLTEFLSGTQTVVFSVISDKDACYRWIQGELVVNAEVIFPSCAEVKIPTLFR